MNVFAMAMLGDWNRDGVVSTLAAEVLTTVWGGGIGGGIALPAMGVFTVIG